MKNRILILTLSIFTLFACSKDDANLSLQKGDLQKNSNNLKKSKKNKIDICHYDVDEDRWFIININENAWSGHNLHGDVRLDDQDNDGFVPNNECGYGQQGDCDDNNADINPNADRMAIGRALLEVQAMNVAEILPYYTDDIEYHDPIVDIYGIEDMTAFLNQLIIGASPNLVTTVEDETLIDDIYSATWTMSGDFLGIPYMAKGISIFKFLPDCSKVYYQRDYYSEGDIMATIPGLDEAINGFRTYYKCSVDPIFDCPFVLPATNPDFSSPNFQNQIVNDQLTVGRQLVEINASNWTNVLSYLTADYEYHDPIVDIYGPATMAEFLGRLFAGSSSLYTVVEDETIVNDIYMATWTMSGSFNGAPFSAPGMSIVKFVPGTTQTYYSRDYYTEGDVMLGVPELAPAVQGFRHYYRLAVDPNYP
jgi:hypothetical protein